ncbi:MAG: hypothetical protein BGN96_10910 [Bacteroidales bacterium 45-6]|nr:MAG: hypothetical protein BGN96_10910 [Bacteroidales bacterium 45-6]
MKQNMMSNKSLKPVVEKSCGVPSFFKEKLNRMATFRNMLYLLVVSVLAVSCTRDYEAPPFNETEYIGKTNNITIAAFRAKYASATNTPTSIVDTLILKATVVGNDISGNIYKQLYIQDETGGIVLGVDQSGINSTYAVGQQIYLSMKGLSALTYGGELQIGYAGTGANRIPWLNFTANASLDKWPDTTRFKPKVVKIADLDGNVSTLMHTLIELDSVYFVNGGTDRFAVSTDPKTTAVNQIIKDKAGKSIVVRTSTYADFAADSLPKGYGKLVGIIGRFESATGKTWQLFLRSKADVKDFDGKVINVGGVSGDGKEATPYNVAAAIANQGKTGFIKGYIVGNVDATGKTISTESKFAAPFTVATNILLADSPTETDYTKCIPVQLPSGVVRTGLNLVDNASNLGKEVTIYGSLEAYFNVAGLKTPVYYSITGGASGGTKPDPNTVLSETLLTQDSFNKFTAFSVTGDQVWTFSTNGYGAIMSGYASSANHANEDWLISPVINLAGRTSGTVSFEHARGPLGSINVGVTAGYYTVWVSNDYSTGAPSTGTWAQLTGINYGTSAWGYVSSGALTIPAANLKANTRIAFKYLSTDTESATWEIKNLVVK